jgi:hypothetical protein
MLPNDLRNISSEDRAAIAIALIYGVFASDSSLTLSDQLLPQLQKLEQLPPGDRLTIVIQILQALQAEMK